MKALTGEAFLWMLSLVCFSSFIYGMLAMQFSLPAVNFAFVLPLYCPCIALGIWWTQGHFAITDLERQWKIELKYCVQREIGRSKPLPTTKEHLDNRLMLLSEQSVIRALNLTFDLATLFGQ